MVAKCEGLEKESVPPALCAAAHATFSYLLPDLQSLTLETRVFFIYEGTKRHLSALS